MSPALIVDSTGAPVRYVRSKYGYVYRSRPAEYFAKPIKEFDALVDSLFTGRWGSGGSIRDFPYGTFRFMRSDVIESDTKIAYEGLCGVIYSAPIPDYSFYPIADFDDFCRHFIPPRLFSKIGSCSYVVVSLRRAIAEDKVKDLVALPEVA